MLNSSSNSLSARLLEAVARECCIMSEDIAWLGGQVSSGTAGIADLQAFDFLAQQAQTQAMLIVQIARLKEGAPVLADMSGLIDTIPLPAVRARLLHALNGDVPARVDDNDAVLWV
jgi:hypothetical protein